MTRDCVTNGLSRGCNPRLLIGGVLLLASACTAVGPTESTVTERSAVVLSSDVLGFESPSLWQAGVALTRNNAHTQGAFSLGVAAKGYVPVTSVALPPPIKVDPTLTVNLSLPTTQANPFWFGALPVFFNSPSANIYNAYVGQVELTGLPLGSFQTLPLKVPDDLRARIQPNATDFKVTVVINVPVESTGVYLLDWLSLATAVAACNASNSGASCDDGNPCTNGDKCSGSVCKGTAIPGCGFDSSTQTATVSWNQATVLNAYFPTCTNPGDSVEFPNSTTFAIPSTITVKGKAAISLALKLGQPFHPDVTCTYSASTSTSTAARPATLTSCSDGSTAGTQFKGTAFSLRVTSAPGVTSPGDGVCAHSAVSAQLPLGIDVLPILPEPLSAAETTALRTGFSWSATQPVAELDAQGRPLLYYALIYLENVKHAKYLDDLHIHHDFLPIFEGLERWRGMRGVFVHHGDGNGVYTYALLSGAHFNFLRTGALAGNVIFKAVNLIPVPPRFANPDGTTVSYRALANAGFRYRGIDPRVPVAPLAPILCDGDIGAGVKGLIQTGSNGLHDVENAINGFLGGLAGDVVGTVDVRLRLRAFNADPTFNDVSALPPSANTTNAIIANQPGIVKREMRRAWGPAPGFPLTNNGATVEVRGVSFASYRSATLSNDSDASIEFNKGLDTAVCLLPRSTDVDVIDFLTTAELCDFGSYSTDVSTHIDIDVANDIMNVFATISDNAEFSRTVFGHGADGLQVLVGHYADLLPNPITPCFTKNNLFASTMATILGLYTTGQGDPQRGPCLGRRASRPGIVRLRGGHDRPEQERVCAVAWCRVP